MSRTTVVDFENPPINEVVCGAVLMPVENLATAHFGLLWSNYADEFPKTQDMLPLPGVSNVDLRPRIWFMSVDEQRIIQVQRDRFHFNWRRVDEKLEYPHFDAVYAAYSRHFGTYRSFLSDLGGAQVARYELTYVNHILVPPDDSTFLARVLPDMAWRHTKGRYLSAPVGYQWTTEYEIPILPGRLRIVARTALKVLAEPRPILSLELTVSGEPGDQSEERMVEWFDGAHEAIVHGFVDVTNLEFQKSLWKRRV